MPQYCLCEVREYIVRYSDTCYLKNAHIIFLVRLLRVWYILVFRLLEVALVGLSITSFISLTTNISVIKVCCSPHIKLDKQTYFSEIGSTGENDVNNLAKIDLLLLLLFFRDLLPLLLQ